jgi:hypothetical protein
MKKYFMAGTDDELQFGDVIELDFVREMKNGKVKHQHMEVKFIPELVDVLIENEVIEEKEEDITGCDKKAIISFLEDDFEDDLEDRVEELEDRVTELEGAIAKLME